MKPTTLVALALVQVLALGGAFVAGRGGCCCGSRSTENEPAKAASVPSTAPVAPAATLPGPVQAVTRDSLVYLPFNSLTNENPEAAQAARMLLQHLDTGSPDPLRPALEVLKDLAAREDFGGEYTTLQWYCEYELADAAARREMEKNPEGRLFLDMFVDRPEVFREYLMQKFGLARPRDPEQLRFLDEVVRFNSPYRTQWERSDWVVEQLALRPGMEVADVGAGAGYFTWRFARAVGPEGKVHAVETNRRHLDLIQRVAAVEGLGNVIPVATAGDFPSFPEGSLDRVFLCSTYQAIFMSFREPARAAWLAALTRSLKDDGLLVISENEPAVAPGVVPYRGISVSRPLVEGQLRAYGFDVLKAEHYVPQRYLLVLRKPSPATAGGGA